MPGGTVTVRVTDGHLIPLPHLVHYNPSEIGQLTVSDTDTRCTHHVSFRDNLK